MAREEYTDPNHIIERYSNMLEEAGRMGFTRSYSSFADLLDQVRSADDESMYDISSLRDFAYECLNYFGVLAANSLRDQDEQAQQDQQNQQAGRDENIAGGELANTIWEYDEVANAIPYNSTFLSETYSTDIELGVPLTFPSSDVVFEEGISIITSKIRIKILDILLKASQSNQELEIQMYNVISNYAMLTEFLHSNRSEDLDAKRNTTEMLSRGVRTSFEESIRGYQLHGQIDRSYGSTYSISRFLHLYITKLAALDTGLIVRTKLLPKIIGDTDMMLKYLPRTGKFNLFGSRPIMHGAAGEINTIQLTNMHLLLLQAKPSPEEFHPGLAKRLGELSQAHGCPFRGNLISYLRKEIEKLLVTCREYEEFLGNISQD